MTPRKTRFDRKFRGYDKAEVDNYIYKLINDNKSLKNKISANQSKYYSAEKQLNHYHKLEHTMQQAILDAQETADNIKISARQTAKGLLDKARLDSDSKIKQATKRADNIINDSLNKSNNISKGAMSLCKNIRRFRHQIIILLNSQLSFTKSRHWDHIFNLKGTLASSTKGHTPNKLHSSDDVLNDLKNSNSVKNDSSSLKTKIDHKNGFAEVIYPNGNIKELKKL